MLHSRFFYILAALYHFSIYKRKDLKQKMKRGPLYQPTNKPHANDTQSRQFNLAVQLGLVKFEFIFFGTKHSIQFLFAKYYLD